MGSLLPYLHNSGCHTRLILVRRFCNSSVPPPESPKKKDTTWNVDQLQKDFLKKVHELRAPISSSLQKDFLKKVHELRVPISSSLQKDFLKKVHELRVPISSSLQKTQVDYADKANFWMRRYENFVGIAEVKKAQNRVMEAEQKFIQTQDQRRDMQSKIIELQNAVKAVHFELEKTVRGEDRYLDLLTQEHQILKEEKQCLQVFRQLEAAERDSFSTLSNSLRDSHEKERAQTEKTKYWSIIGSILGSLVGVIGSSINNRIRMQEVRDLVNKAMSGEALREVYLNVLDEFKVLKEDFIQMSRDVEKFHKMTPVLPLNVKPSAHATQEDVSKRIDEVYSIINDLSRQIKALEGSFLAARDSTKNQMDVIESLKTPVIGLQKEFMAYSQEMKSTDSSKLLDKKIVSDYTISASDYNKASSDYKISLGWTPSIILGGCLLFGALRLFT